jgi:hypothetical protein
VYALAIPVLLVLELAVTAERWAHEAPPARRTRTFLASDTGVLCLIFLLAATGVGGLFAIR